MSSEWPAEIALSWNPCSYYPIDQCYYLKEEGKYLFVKEWQHSAKLVYLGVLPLAVVNTKKSWHPNTMKNQERVWKAEKAAAEESKRILELQRERAQERDRAELNDLVKQHSGAGSNSDRLHWMYDKPDKKGQQEDYLLGRAIEKNYDKPDKPDESIIPAVARRVVGSSMLLTGGDTQVDIARKVREDPLLLIKERERAARAALLNNPIHRRKITELLKKEQDKKKAAPKKSKNNELDNKLAEKLNSLGGENSVDLAALLASGSSSSSESSSEDEKPKSKKNKKKDKKAKKKKKSKRKSVSPEQAMSSEKKFLNKKRTHDSSDDESEEGPKLKRYYDYMNDEATRTQSSGRERNQQRESRRDYENRQESSKSRRDQRSGSDSSGIERRERQRSSHNQRTERSDHTDRERRRGSVDRSRPKQSSSRRRDSSEEVNKESRQRGKVERRGRSAEKGRGSSRERKKEGRSGLSEAEKAERIAAMAAAGAAREQERARRVAAGRQPSPEPRPRPRAGASAQVLPQSLSARIHSTRHYIQRGKQHMNEHFARR